jgi:Ca2+-binding EF-hand superfamily protein
MLLFPNQVENIFRVIRAGMKSDRTLYGKVLADAAEAFRVMDTDGSGALDREEFGNALERMGLGLTSEQVRACVEIFCDTTRVRLQMLGFCTHSDRLACRALL